MRLLLLLLLVLLLLPCLSAVCIRASDHVTSRAAQTRAHLSPLVFLGTLRSVLVQRDGTVRAWFAVDRTLKGQDALKGDAEVVYRRTRGCVLDMHQDNLRLASQYLVFGEGGAGHVAATALPLPNDKRTLRAVKKIVCEGCAKPPVVSGLERRRRVAEGEKVRLNCHLAGNPIPWVEWYKDGVRIATKGRVKVKTKRRTSRLVIRRARPQDRGLYECRAGNIVQEDPVSIQATLVVTRTTTPTPSQFDEKRQREPCPIPGYCHNGGTCSFIKDIRELYCVCADGYRGERCDFKDVSISVGSVKNYSSRGDIP